MPGPRRPRWPGVLVEPGESGHPVQGRVVVDSVPDVVTLELSNHGGAVRTADHELVVNVPLVSIYLLESEGRSGESGPVPLRDRSPLEVPVIEMAELDPQDGCLDLVEAAVETVAPGDPVGVVAVVFEGPEPFREIRPPRDTESPITTCAEILRGVK